MNFCRDCIHLRDADRRTFEKCGRTAKPGVDLVTGVEFTQYNYCAQERAKGIPGICGPDGVFFEPRGEVVKFEQLRFVDIAPGGP